MGCCEIIDGLVLLFTVVDVFSDATEKQQQRFLLVYQKHEEKCARCENENESQGQVVYG